MCPSGKKSAHEGHKSEVNVPFTKQVSARRTQKTKISALQTKKLKGRADIHLTKKIRQWKEARGFFLPP
ncbi:hypothetical protein [Alkalibacterium putridalgicola]|uniref:hypothetical protein n=1 Tax=Alkalibacterium putridalgicola TaxID=426703 RepID=UPI000B88E16E|nr:hypothetical protein [Alkalibacterium putridalgicola]